MYFLHVIKKMTIHHTCVLCVFISLFVLMCEDDVELAEHANSKLYWNQLWV